MTRQTEGTPRLARAGRVLAALLLVGCDGATSTTDGGGAVDHGGGADLAVDATPVTCDAVTLTFAGSVATVAGKPLGLDSAVRTAPITGSLGYAPCSAVDKSSDPRRGEYEVGGTGVFTLLVAGRSISGSGNPLVQVENYDPDTFRFLDGPQLLDKDPLLRAMKVDGVRSTALKVSLAITDSDGKAFASDALPTSFPLLAVASYPHTFSVEDGGGTLLLQLTSMTQQ